MKKKLLLLDGFSILFRAFYGMPMQMTSPDGTHTNAVYGFLTILNKVIEDEKPDFLAVAFDRPEPTFRHELYPAYKGTRSEAPPEFKEQVPVIKDLLADMNIPVITAAGFEADDVLGTLARLAEKENISAVIVSGDRDLLQTASAGTAVVIPKTRGGKTEYQRYTPAEVEETYGVTPEAFIELKALMGDSSDNVPGLPGVGEKTAAKILAQFGSIENARAHVDEIKPKKAMEAMRDHFDQLALSKELVTIRTDAPVEFTEDAFKVRQIYNPKAYESFRRLGFRSLLARFETADAPEEPSAAVPENGKPYIVLSMEDFAVKCASLSPEDEIGLAFAEDNGTVYAAALTCKDGTFSCLGSGDPLWDSMLSSRSGRTACTDAKSVYRVLGTGKELPLFDVTIAAYLLNPLKNDWDYEAVASGFLGRTIPSRADLIGKKGLAEASEEACLELAAHMARTAFEAMPLLGEKLAEEEMLTLFEETEMPLTRVLAGMEEEGILVSREELAKYADSLSGRIEELKTRIYEAAGEEFNLNSPKQLSVILFEKMQIPGGKKTKTGYSTAADVLEKLAEEHPIVADILEYRTYAKLKSTYADGLPEYIARDGRIHTTFGQTITATGRLSSADPNLQNIPMRMELGRKIRKCFYPAPGCVFVDADYSQIELRILAHMSGDEKLIEAYKEAKDIHRTTASQVFHVPFEDVTDLQRRNAKAVNFGIVYGISSFGLSQGLSISREEAAAYIRQYFATYPKIKAFLDGLVESAKEKGYALSLYGRRRPVPELKASNFMQRSFGERVAMNAPIQGTAADIMKIAMIRVVRRLEKEQLKAKLLLQIHDELLIEAPEEEAEAVGEILTEEMKAAASLSVTLEVDCHTGSDWYEAK